MVEGREPRLPFQQLFGFALDLDGFHLPHEPANRARDQNHREDGERGPRGGRQNSRACEQIRNHGGHQRADDERNRPERTIRPSRPALYAFHYYRSSLWAAEGNLSRYVI